MSEIELPIDLTLISAIGSPIPLFKKWLDEAALAKVIEPNAMCLSTITSENTPASRYVLLKGITNDNGFVWFTNYKSRKGAEL